MVTAAPESQTILTAANGSRAISEQRKKMRLKLSIRCGLGGKNKFEIFG
jgi:hypothetical protein